MVDARPATKVHPVSQNECKGCNAPIKKYSSWCKNCVSSHFSKNFKNWTSGNKNLDEFIHEIQLNEQRFNLAIEWIPFDRFTDITFIKQGGFGTVYKASWLDGYINEWNLEKNEWKRAGKKTVCLKQIHNSKNNITKEFLEAIQHQVKARSTRVISVYGFTQDASTKDYMIVMQYSSEGSLRESLNKNFNSLSWHDKLSLLKDSANGLKDIHKLGLHRDLHSGNIIMIDKSTPNFSDFGMCKPIAMEICKGLRPEYKIEELPPLILEYIKRCWDQRTSNRPTAQDIFYNISQWLESYKDEESTLYKQIKKIEESKNESSSDIEKKSGPLKYQINPLAIYNSRLLEFPGLKNSATILDPIFELMSIEPRAKRLKKEESIPPPPPDNVQPQENESPARMIYHSKSLFKCNIDFDFSRRSMMQTFSRTPPYNQSTVYKDELENHLEYKCNSRPKPNPPYFSLNINCTLPAPERDGRFALSELDKEALERLIHDVDIWFDRIVLDIKTLVLDHEALREKMYSHFHIKLD
ncbi:15400_t:CDS:2 [Acaulospora colombiana]|uniref:15400_t:CDS:1 n=1 Tax=Acaulospora colombiana TaxID=27376 RepID=A0ACA9L1V4_9GLOM|nr:15400_t:CDS:2 [Acaulospora colombiana]